MVLLDKMSKHGLFKNLLVLAICMPIMAVFFFFQLSQRSEFHFRNMPETIASDILDVITN